MGARIEPEPPVSPPEGAQQEASHLHLVSAVEGSAQKPSGKRSLSASELLAARKVFVSGINYPPVSIERMASFTEFFAGNRAHTLGNTIDLPSKVYVVPEQYLSIIIHELVHVWQYQHGGMGYAPSAVWAQIFGDGYDFAKALRQGKPWAKMNPEQQAQMIQEAFRSAYFDTPGALFGVLNTGKGTVVRSGTRPPEGFTDYTSALVDALAVLRKAP